MLKMFDLGTFPYIISNEVLKVEQKFIVLYANLTSAKTNTQ